jgi:negative regulator of replication initiation
MRMHQVEVDDEVFSLVKRHAEPLVDTFNSALRRLLPVGKPRASHLPNGKHQTQHQFPAGTPEALRQILEVARLVRSGHSRRDATRYVAKQFRVAYQTVCDKYARQLDLKASQFDRLLELEKSEELRALLRSKFPEHTNVIDRVLNSAPCGERGQKAFLAADTPEHFLADIEALASGEDG